jgi:signal transduction histidine kinase
MRRRILLLVIGVTLVVVLAFAIPIAILLRNTVAQRAEDDTRRLAQTAAGFLRSTSAPPTRRQLRSYLASQPLGGRSMSIAVPDGAIVGSTPADRAEQQPGHRPDEGTEPDHGPGGDVPPADLQPAPGGQVAVAVAPSLSGPYVVRVFLSNGRRYDGLTGWYSVLGAASGGLLLLAVGAGEVLTRRITRPLVRTAETAQRLSVGDVAARAPVEGPREIADVGKGLNRLADRIDELIAEERETVADLSHRLRTPLTTLRLDAEALRDPVEAERVGTHVGDVERMLTAVIHAARRPQREGRMPSCDAVEIVRSRVEFWSALTEEQGRHSDISVPSGSIRVRASADDLAAAVDALLENVVAHTPEGTGFSVRLSADGTGARLEIDDEGLGITDAALIRGRSDRGSTGLGLDIARRCAETSGGSMRVTRSHSGGALVILELGGP